MGLGQRVEIEPRLADRLVFLGQQQVHAVGSGTDLLVDPAQLEFELLGRVVRGPEAPQPARAGDLGDDVATVGEPEDRDLDAEHPADGVVHDLRCNEGW